MHYRDGVLCGCFGVLKCGGVVCVGFVDFYRGRQCVIACFLRNIIVFRVWLCLRRRGGRALGVYDLGLRCCEIAVGLQEEYR